MAARRKKEQTLLGRTIRSFLTHHKIKLAEAADEMDLSYGGLKKLVYERPGIGPRTAKILAAYFGTDPEFWLLIHAKDRLAQHNGFEPKNTATRPIKPELQKSWLEANGLFYRDPAPVMGETLESKNRSMLVFPPNPSIKDGLKL